MDPTYSKILRLRTLGWSHSGHYLTLIRVFSAKFWRALVCFGVAMILASCGYESGTIDSDDAEDHSQQSTFVDSPQLAQDESVPSDSEIVALVNAEFDAFCRTRDCSVYPTGYVTWEQGDQRFYRNVDWYTSKPPNLKRYYNDAVRPQEPDIFLELDAQGIVVRAIFLRPISWRFYACCRALQGSWDWSASWSGIEGIWGLRFTIFELESFGPGEQADSSVSDPESFPGDFAFSSREWGGFRLVGENRSKSRRIRIYESVDPIFMGEKAIFFCTGGCALKVTLRDQVRLAVSTGVWRPTFCNRRKFEGCEAGASNFADSEYDHVVSEELLLLSKLADELPNLELFIKLIMTNPQEFANGVIDD